jgi:hypothetical protein
MVCIVVFKQCMVCSQLLLQVCWQAKDMLYCCCYCCWWCLQGCLFKSCQQLCVPHTVALRLPHMPAPPAHMCALRHNQAPCDLSCCMQTYTPAARRPQEQGKSHAVHRSAAARPWDSVAAPGALSVSRRIPAQEMQKQQHGWQPQRQRLRSATCRLHTAAQHWHSSRSITQQGQPGWAGVSKGM